MLKLTLDEFLRKRWPIVIVGSCAVSRKHYSTARLHPMATSQRYYWWGGRPRATGQNARRLSVQQCTNGCVGNSASVLEPSASAVILSQSSTAAGADCAIRCASGRMAPFLRTKCGRKCRHRSGIVNEIRAVRNANHATDLNPQRRARHVNFARHHRP